MRDIFVEWVKEDQMRWDLHGIKFISISLTNFSKKKWTLLSQCSINTSWKPFTENLIKFIAEDKALFLPSWYSTVDWKFISIKFPLEAIDTLNHELIKLSCCYQCLLTHKKRVTLSSFGLYIRCSIIVTPIYLLIAYHDSLVRPWV